MTSLIPKERIKSRRIKSKIFKVVSMSSFVFCILFLAFFIFSLINSGIGEFTRYYVKIDVIVTEKLIQNPYSLTDPKKKYISRAWLRNLPNLIKREGLEIGDAKSFLAASNADVDGFLKRNFTKLSSEEMKEVLELSEKGVIVSKFNSDFFTKGDSKIPENAGFLSAIVGSVLVMIVAMGFAFPIGAASAV